MSTFRRGLAGRSIRAVIAGLVAGAVLAPNAAADQPVFELLTIGPADGIGRSGPLLVGTSADGKHVIFATDESLVSGDTDSFYDVYERFAGQTTLVSTGATSGGQISEEGSNGVSRDGKRVFFYSVQQRVSSDTDDCIDVYERFAGTTTLVSTGPIEPDDCSAAEVRGMSDDGTHAFFETAEKLVSNDLDGVRDVYERSGGQTTLLTPGGTLDSGASFLGASADGETVFVYFGESLDSADTDTRGDIYERSANGQMTLISTGPNGGSGSFDPQFRAVSDDGSRVLFTTEESLVSTDTDTFEDLYVRVGGQTTLVSTGPAGGNGAFPALAACALDVCSSNDLAHVYFTTKESLVSEDTDSEYDIYEHTAGTTSLVSVGPEGGSGTHPASFRGISRDGTHAYFWTYESLVSSDTDLQLDIYQRAGGQTTLMSTGPSGGNGPFDVNYRDYGGATPDGSRMFFETDEPLVSDDTDSELDVYERAGDQTTLISPGSGFHETLFRAVSDDGARVIFETAEPLTSADTDFSDDLYERRLVSKPPTPSPAAPPPPPPAAPPPTAAVAPPACPSGTSATVRCTRDAKGRLVMTGTRRAETLVGTAGDDRIVAGGGNDTIDGRGGRDSISGGVGRDRIKGGTGNDRINGGSGNDRIDGGGGRDSISGGSGNDRISGGSGNDRINGGKGNDRLAGEKGNDRLTGSAGNDRLKGNAGRDRLSGGSGKDQLSGGTGRDRLNCGSGKDRVRGTRGDRVSSNCE